MSSHGQAFRLMDIRTHVYLDHDQAFQMVPEKKGETQLSFRPYFCMDMPTLFVHVCVALYLDRDPTLKIV